MLASRQQRRWPTSGIVPQSRHDTPGLLGRSVHDLQIAVPALERGFGIAITTRQN
jgi:hypothetical protein